MAAAIEPIPTPALTREHAGILLINLLASINQVPAAPTDYFITQSSNIPLIKDEFDLTPSIESVLVISNPMGEIETSATVGEPSDRPLNLRGLNALTKPAKPERRTPKGIHIIKSPFAQAFEDIIRQNPRLWKDNGIIKMAEDKLIMIPLVNNWNRIKLGQRPYPVGQKNRELINKTLNKLHRKGRIKWVTKPTPFATPVFVA